MFSCDYPACSEFFDILEGGLELLSFGLSGFSETEEYIVIFFASYIKSSLFITKSEMAPGFAY